MTAFNTDDYEPLIITKKARCSNCGELGHKRPTCKNKSTLSFVEAANLSDEPIEVPQNILEYQYKHLPTFPTYIKALDAVFVSRMGEVGIPSGGRILLTGQPGTGKTTMIAQVLDGLSQSGCECVLASNEMDTNSIAGMVRSLDLKKGFRVLEDQTQTKQLLTTIAAMVNNPDFGRRQIVLAVDSLQGLNLDQRNPTAKAWNDFEVFAKETGVIVLVINHLTKTGDMAGAASIRQRCDTVLNLQRESDNTLTIGVEKNRFGMIADISNIKMESKGLNFSGAMVLQEA